MEYRNILSPSILAADFGHLARDIRAIEEAGAEYVHIDIMDGNFVPSISFGMPALKSIRPITEMIFDVHLMIDEPLRYIGEFADLGADIITVHVEACRNVKATLEAILKRGVKAGITLKPETPASALTPYLSMVDMVLVMSVEPGFGGQEFIEESIDKIKEIKDYRDREGLFFDIEVDGGVCFENIGRICRAGANVIVAGSAVFGGNAPDNVRSLHRLMQDAVSPEGSPDKQGNAAGRTRP